GGEHLAVEDVDLEVTDAQARDQLTGAAVRPPDHRAGAGNEVVRHERDADVVVGAALEGVELPAQVAAPGEGDHTYVPLGARLVDELNRPPGLGVDVDHKEMGLPFRDRALRVVDRLRDLA